VPRHGLHPLSNKELGRVLDPEALDASGGARVRLSIEVPASWLAEPCELDIVAPRRLVCARCDGGGCDGCGRGGAWRAPQESEARTVCIRLGPTAPGVAIRVAEPFGRESEIAQLILEVRRGKRPSPGVTRRVTALAQAPLPARRPPAWPGLLLLVLSAAAAILLSLIAR
jgi:hypothetical protein